MTQGERSPPKPSQSRNSGREKEIKEYNNGGGKIGTRSNHRFNAGRTNQRQKRKKKSKVKGEKLLATEKK